MTSEFAESFSPGEISRTDQDSPLLSSKEVVLGTVVEVDFDGSAWIDYPGNPEQSPIRALSTTAIGIDSVGRQAALLFVGGDPRQPIIMGLVRTILDPCGSGGENSKSRADEVSAKMTNEAIEIQGDHPEKVCVDGKSVHFKAEREIVLKCGKSSITLTRSGKILIRGAYLLNRSSGVNRIKGGSVQIN